MHLPKFVAIAACDPLGVIGKGGRLPWHCPEDLEHFYRSTLDQVIIMGYQTFSSLPDRVFQNRHCFVFTQNHTIDKEGVVPIGHLKELEDFYSSHPTLWGKTNFVIGGSRIFELFFREHLIEVALMTHMRTLYEGDSYFPLHYIASWSEKTLCTGLNFAIHLHTKKEAKDES